jgi:AcrR family transcriptional regulator
MKAPSVRRAEAKAGMRPRRGSPEETRKRIVMAAAREFEEHGYFGTDSNEIARAAGYAPGTFYKHFVDKRAIFLAVYEEWVTSEWTEISRCVRSETQDAGLAATIVDLVIAHHRAWPVFRASLKLLVATDAEVRKHHRAWRRKQLGIMGELGGGADPANTALTLLISERVADAIADGEAAALGVNPAAARDFLIARASESMARGNRRLARTGRPARRTAR